MYKIPLSVPSIQGNEWKYVKECLDSEWVSSAGKYVDLFEQIFNLIGPWAHIGTWAQGPLFLPKLCLHMGFSYFPSK